MSFTDWSERDCRDDRRGPRGDAEGTSQVATTLDTLAARCNTNRMTNTKSPIEVWLRQTNLTVDCTVVNEDESTEDYNVSSLSMRGAQREMTGYFIREGYRPDGRWTPTTEAVHDAGVEAWRRFKASP